MNAVEPLGEHEPRKRSAFGFEESLNVTGIEAMARRHNRNGKITRANVAANVLLDRVEAGGADSAEFRLLGCISRRAECKSDELGDVVWRNSQEVGS